METTTQRNLSLWMLTILGWGLGIAAVALWRPLLPIDETRYLTVAWEMWHGGDWILPHLNGAPYGRKPPLMFWMIQGLWSLFGVKLIPVQIAWGLLGLITLVLTAVLAKKLYPQKTNLGSQAALILSGTVGFMFYNSIVMFDILLTIGVLVGFLGLSLAWLKKSWQGWILFAFGIGLGIFAKGPVILIHLLIPAVLAPFWLRQNKPKSWSGWYGWVLVAVLIGVVMGLAWAIPAALAGGKGYTHAIFWGQTAKRVVNSFSHRHPVWYYLVLSPVLLFPWILWLPFWRAGKNWFLKTKSETSSFWRGLDDSTRFLLVWALGTFLAFSMISGKQIHYLVPLYPAVAIFLAFILRDAEEEASQRLRTHLLPFLPILLCGTAVLYLTLATPAHPWKWIPNVLLNDLSSTFGAILFLGGVILLSLGFLFPRYRIASLAHLVVLIFCTVHFQGWLGSFAPYDLRPSAGLLSGAQHGGLATVNPYEGEMTFLGRFESPVEVIRPEEAAQWLRDHPQGALFERYKKKPSVPLGPPTFKQPYREGEMGLWIPHPELIRE